MSTFARWDINNFRQSLRQGLYAVSVSNEQQSKSKASSFRHSTVAVLAVIAVFIAMS